MNAIPLEWWNHPYRLGRARSMGWAGSKQFVFPTVVSPVESELQAVAEDSRTQSSLFRAGLAVDSRTFFESPGKEK